METFAKRFRSLGPSRQAAVIMSLSFVLAFCVESAVVLTSGRVPLGHPGWRIVFVRFVVIAGVWTSLTVATVWVNSRVKRWRRNRRDSRPDSSTPASF